MPRSSPLFFDRFELQPAERRLLRDGEPVALRARAFDLLQVLAERAGSLVTKAELLDLVWSGLVVEENNIAAQIAGLRKLLGNELIATVPGRGYRFSAVMRTAADAAQPLPAPALAPPAATPRPPATSRLFGRDADQRALEAALREGGCVTLVGPGGVGKTALARAVADATDARAAWVDLAALADGAQLAGAVQRALGIASFDAAVGDAALAAALADGPALLVLDNAEHVVDATAAMAQRLTRAAPRLALLVTSQLPLRIDGERVHALEPLGLPGDAQSDAEAMSTPAVQLLLARVRAIDPRWPAGVETLPLLRRLCAGLDGLPLALEMAAALVPMLGWQGVLGALDERFAALRRGRRDAPSRHKTLLAALEWSHGLLPPVEQRVFRRLGVLASGFSLELAIAVAVAADPGEPRWDVIDALSELVDRSLVASLHVDPPRYRLLETTRSFALAQLAASDEGARVRQRAVAALTGVMGQGSSGSLDPIAAAELGNVPELLDGALSNDPASDPAAAIALALAAGRVATWTAWLGEAAHWLERCEPFLAAHASAATQAEWWRELARFQTFVRGPRAVEAARHACEIERRLANPEGLFWSLVPLLRSRALDPDEFEAARREAQALLDAHPDWPPRNQIVFSGSLAMEYRRRGDFEAAWPHQQREAELAAQNGLAQIAANAESNLVATLVGLGRHAEALARLDDLLRSSAAAPSPIGAHNRLQRLNALIGLGRFDAAAAHAADTLQWCRRYDVTDVLQVLAQLAARQGRLTIAAMLLGQHRALLERRGAEPAPETHAPWRDAWRLVEAGLDARALGDAMARGAQLDAAAADRLFFAAPDELTARTP